MNTPETAKQPDPVSAPAATKVSPVAETPLADLKLGEASPVSHRDPIQDRGDADASNALRAAAKGLKRSDVNPSAAM